MGDLPNRASRNPSIPLPPVGYADMGRMVSSQHEIGSPASRKHSSVAFISHGGPYLTPKTTVASTHALQKSQHGNGIMYREHLADRQEQRGHPNMHSKMSVVHNPPPPGMFPHGVNAPRRPPMITEEAIKDYKERTMSLRIQPDGRLKDIHRHLRVVHVIGKFVQEYNQLNHEDPYMQYRWYGTDQNDNKTTTTLLAIIEDSAHALIPHLYSEFTYNDAQRRDCASMEALVARVASHDMFDPLTQAQRCFGIRKLIQDKMATKKKTRDRQKKRERQNILQNEAPSNAAVSIFPASYEATLTVPDLPFEVHPRSDTLDRLAAKRVDHDEAILKPRCRDDDHTERKESSAEECETIRERNGSPSMPHDRLQQAAAPCIKEGITNQLSKIREKSGRAYHRSKGKKNKAKKASSRPTARNVRAGSAYEPNVRPSEHRDNSAEHSSRNEAVVDPTKYRKRKRSAKESSSSESSPGNTDSDDREVELAELKKRMKEIEKRKTKKKGKKNRIR